MRNSRATIKLGISSHQGSIDTGMPISGTIRRSNGARFSDLNCSDAPHELHLNSWRPSRDVIALEISTGLLQQGQLRNGKIM
jgi:hypothetical protein